MSVDWQRGLRPVDMSHRLEDWIDRFLQAALALANDWANLLQTYMQEHAPWTDRTSNARQGLTVTAHLVEMAIVLTLFHTMEYGIWLEVANAGNYAIIMPTIEGHMAALLDEFAALAGG